MMIVVTRPYPDGPQLVNQLISSGLSAVYLPLFITPARSCAELLQTQLNSLSIGDIVIAVSPRVITSLEANERPIHFPKYIHYAAIGKKTAFLLQRLTKIAVAYPLSNQNSEGLLTLPLFKTISQKRILILRGNQGREWLANKLKHRGAVTNYIECYKRIPIHYSANHTHYWPRGTIVIVTSIDSLCNLNSLISKSRRHYFTLITSSERIANHAMKSSWSSIVLSQSADNKILFKTILTLCHNKRGLESQQNRDNS